MKEPITLLRLSLGNPGNTVYLTLKTCLSKMAATYTANFKGKESNDALICILPLQQIPKNLKMDVAAITAN